MTLIYPMAAIRSAEDDDDRLWPVLSGPSEQFPLDLAGESATLIAGRGLEVQHMVEGRKPQTLIDLHDAAISIAITDTRVIIACEKYTKGGGFVGIGAGALVAAAANSVSRARATRRRRGKVLAAQVRYPWLAAAAGLNTPFVVPDWLRISVRNRPEHGDGNQVVTVGLTRGHDVHQTAAEIARRAALWRLANLPKFTGEEQKAELQRLSAVTPHPPNKGSKTFASHRMTGIYWFEPGPAFAGNEDLMAAWEARQRED